jgi:3-oxoacyl-[acyl-carrier-protein] synthase II
MLARRVVITGLGIVAPNGIGKEAFWQAKVNGLSGVSAVRHFDTSGLRSKIAGAIYDFDPAKFMAPLLVRRTDRFVHLGLAASRLALVDSRLNLGGEDPKRIGCIIGSGLGGVLFHEEQIEMALEKGLNRLSPQCVPRIAPNAVSGHIAIEFNLRGPNMTISSACASGTIALGEAFRKIAAGGIDLALAGGAEAPLTRFTFAAYCSLPALSTRNGAPQEACRPFDRDRDGMVLGEGAAILVLEELSHALHRGASIYAEVVGYAHTSGAYNMIVPVEDGHDVADVMLLAIQDAGTHIEGHTLHKRTRYRNGGRRQGGEPCHQDALRRIRPRHPDIVYEVHDWPHDRSRGRDRSGRVLPDYSERRHSSDHQLPGKGPGV